MIRSFVEFFARRPAATALAWAGVLLVGAFAYVSWLPREGFPPVRVPMATVGGAYFVDDAERLDHDLLIPLQTAVSQRPEVEVVETIARPNTFITFVEFESDFTSEEGTQLLDEVIAGLDVPVEAQLRTQVVSVAKFRDEFDLLVGVTAGMAATPPELEASAALVLPFLEAEPGITSATVLPLLERGIDPATGEPVEFQSEFNQLSVAETADDGLDIWPSVAVGVEAADGIDAPALLDAVERGLAELDRAEELPVGHRAEVAADFATDIEVQLASLQSNVLTGVIAVAAIAFLLISWRASVITAVFILTVMAATMAVLHLVGISLNTVSLFGIILALGLFVDDAIVITEAVDTFRDDSLEPHASIGGAVERVGAASVSGTLTTLLVFAPMLAISGILGEFVRILPQAVIIALIVSLVLSLVVIPVAARYLVLPAASGGGPLAAPIDAAGRALGKVLRRDGGGAVMTGAVAVVSMTALFLIGILVLAPRAGFNIFPPQKDSTLVAAEYAFDPGTSVEAAAGITGEVNRRVAEVLGDDLEQVYVYLGDANRAFAQFRLSPRGGRPTAPQLVDDLLAPIGAETDGARVTFNQVSNGPPEANFPFRLQVFDEDPADLERATAQILAELDGATIERSNGTSFEVVETAVEFSDAVARSDGRRLVQVRARYDADDVTTTTSRTQDFLEERFDADRLAELGLAADAFGFDFGLESDNQESFASMPRAFGIALVLMVLLLIVQFRSSIRWLLVFLAIPFGFFGVFAGLLATDNEISFFVMLGLLGLIGIAVNNTILLTDFANQERASGVSAREAMARALERRLRPLLATTLTTIAGLLPLALSDPFWESLAFTIIFGLISSTLGVVVAFPYCYLAVEWLRDRISTPWSART